MSHEIDDGPAAPGTDPYEPTPSRERTPPPLPNTLRPTVSQADAPPLPDVDYYDLDSRRATVREYLFETRNPLILAIAVLMKVLRVRLPGGSTDDPTVARLAPFEARYDAALSAAPEVTRAPLRQLTRELFTFGYGDPLVHVVPTPLQNTEHAMVTLRAPDGRSVARAHVRVSHNKVPPKVKPYVEFLTPLADGRYVWTCNGVPDTLAPPSCLWQRDKSLDVAQTRELHERRLAEHAAAIAPTRDADAVRALVDAHQAEIVAFHLRRKFFRPADRAAAQVAATAAAAGDVADGPVLVEIDRQLNRGGSWQSAIVLFAVTLFAFAALGASHWGGRFVAILLPVLFFHELGHYLAMRLFGYRNVRMFFLPLVGAAVSGRSFNVAAWKQVIVSLAGPLPGIAVAIPLGIAGLVTHREWMSEAAVVALLLNGSNLLPILPLDGGRVAQLLLFRRAPILDVAFRVVACLTLAGLAVVGGGRFLAYLAAAMGISVPMAARAARATREIRRRRGGAPIVVPTGARSLPPDVAGEIVAELRRGARRPVATKILATQTLEVFDALNAPAPRWPATVGFGLLHGAAVAAVVVFALLFVILRNPELRDAVARLASVQTPLVATDTEQRSGAGYDATARHDSIVAHFAKPAAAHAAFAALPADAKGAACRLGPAIVVETPAGDAGARDAAFDALDAAGGRPTVAEGGWASLTLVARTSGPAAADAIVDLVGGHGAPDGLVPPWIEPDPRTRDERIAHERARRTDAALARVQHEESKAMMERIRAGVGGAKDDAAADADPDQRAIDAASRRGNKAEVSRLYREQAAHQRQRTLAKIDAAVAALGPTGADPEYVELWKSIHEPAPSTRPADDEDAAMLDLDDEGDVAAPDGPLGKRMAELRAQREHRQARQRELLGALPRAPDGRPTPAALPWWCDAGASADERVATLRVEQRSPAVTLPVIVRWLGARSVDLRFELQADEGWPEQSLQRAAEAATRPAKPTSRPTTRRARTSG